MAEELLLFGDLIREGRVAMQLAREEERRSTFSGAMSALKEEFPPMPISRRQAKLCMRDYFAREQATEIAALVATPKL